MLEVILRTTGVSTKSRFLRWTDECCRCFFTALIRVSTAKQADKRNSLAAQAHEIQGFMSRNSLNFDREFGYCPRDGFPYTFPYAYTAIEQAWTWDWQVLGAIRHARDTQRVLVVPGLDRFSRIESVDAIHAKLVEQDICLLVLDLGRPVAPEEIWSGEHQRKAPSRNSNRAATFLESKGWKKRGRPRKLKSSPDDEVTRKLIMSYHSKGLSYRGIAKKLNVQQSLGKWSHKQVIRELARMSDAQVGTKRVPTHIRQPNQASD